MPARGQIRMRLPVKIALGLSIILIAFVASTIFLANPSSSMLHDPDDDVDEFLRFPNDRRDYGDSNNTSENPLGDVYVVLSSSSEKQFAYFVPFAAEAWNKCGFKTLTFFMGRKKYWRELVEHGPLVVDYLRDMDRTPIFISPDMVPPHNSLNFISTVIRIFAPTLQFLKPNDVLLLSDADMLPLKCEYFYDIQNYLKVHPDQFYADKIVNYENVLQNEKTIPRYAICYVAATTAIWRQVMDFPSGVTMRDAIPLVLTKENFKNAFNREPHKEEPFPMDFDEKLLGYKLSKHTNISTSFRLTKRDYKVQHPRGPPLPDYNWEKALSKSLDRNAPFFAELVDAHVGPGSFTLYPSKGNEHKWIILKALMSQVVERSPKIIQKLENYHFAFLQAVQNTTDDLQTEIVEKTSKVIETDVLASFDKTKLKNTKPKAKPTSSQTQPPSQTPSESQPPPSQPSIEPSPSQQSSTEPPLQPTLTESLTQSLTETPFHLSTEQTTEQTTELATEHSTGQPTNLETEHPTESITQSSTKPHSLIEAPSITVTEHLSQPSIFNSTLSPQQTVENTPHSPKEPDEEKEM